MGACDLEHSESGRSRNLLEQIGPNFYPSIDQFISKSFPFIWFSTPVITKCVGGLFKRRSSKKDIGTRRCFTSGRDSSSFARVERRDSKTVSINISVETSNRSTAEASLGRRHQLTLSVEKPTEFDEEDNFQRVQIGKEDPFASFTNIVLIATFNNYHGCF